MTTIYVCDRCGATSSKEMIDVDCFASHDDMGKALCPGCNAIYKGMLDCEHKAACERAKLNRDAFWGRTKPVLRWNQ